MAKSDKKLIRKFQKKYKWAPNTSYNAGFYFGEEYEGTHFITDKDGKIISIVDEQTGAEHNQNIVKQKEQKQIDIEVDKKMKEHIVKEIAGTKKKKMRTKKELKLLKEDPGALRKKLDNAYMAYDEASAKLKEVYDPEFDDISDIPEARILKRKQVNSMKNLYDTATATGSITGEDEKGKAFQYITGMPTVMKKSTLTDTELEEIPGIKPGMPRGSAPLRELSDEELIKKLKLNQQK